MNVKYEKWYDFKKKQEANILYEKLSRLSTGKKILSEEQVVDKDKSLRAAKDICNALGIDIGTTEGQIPLQYYKEMIDKIQHNKGEWKIKDAAKGVKVFLEYAVYANKQFASEFTPSKLASGATSSAVKGGLKQYGKEELAPIGTFAKQAYGDVKKKFTGLFKENLLNEAPAAGAAAVGAAAGEFVAVVVKALAFYGIPLIFVWRVFDLSGEVTEEVAKPIVSTAGEMIQKSRPGLVGTAEKGSKGLEGLAGTLKNVTQSGEKITDPMLGRAEEFSSSSERARTGRLIAATKEIKGETCEAYFRRLAENGFADKILTFDPAQTYNPGEVFDCRKGDCVDNSGQVYPPKVFRVIVKGNSETGIIQTVKCR